MTIAEKVMKHKNNLDIKLSCEGLSIKTFVLLGSKKVIYSFKDDSKIIWNATPNIFQIEN